MLVSDPVAFLFFVALGMQVGFGWWEAVAVCIACVDTFVPRVWRPVPAALSLVAKKRYLLFPIGASSAVAAQRAAFSSVKASWLRSLF